MKKISCIYYFHPMEILSRDNYKSSEYISAHSLNSVFHRIFLFFNSWSSRALQYLQDNALYLRTGQASATPGFLESFVTKDMFSNFKTEKLLVSYALWPKPISTFRQNSEKRTSLRVHNIIFPIPSILIYSFSSSFLCCITI